MRHCSLLKEISIFGKRGCWCGNRSDETSGCVPACQQRESSLRRWSGKQETCMCCHSLTEWGLAGGFCSVAIS